MRILFQENGRSGVYWHRQYVPHVAMAASFPDIVVESTPDISKLSDQQLSKYEIVCMHGRVDTKTIDKIKRCGCKFVYDVDDYWYATPDRLFYNEWKHISHGFVIEGHIMDADAVTCTTEILASYILKHTGVIATILPNAISERDPQFIPVEIPSDRLRFGFVGGSSHTVDIDIIGKAVAKLYRNYPEYRDKWQIVYGGFDLDYRVEKIVGGKHVKASAQQKNIPSVIIEKSLTDNYKICSPEYSAKLRRYTTESLPSDQQYMRLWNLPVDKYATLLNHIDVSLCPLRDDTFNRCKSNLKIIEAGWMGKNVLASDIDCFIDDSIDDDISFCNNSDSFLDIMIVELEDFIEHGNFSKSGLQQSVKQHYSAETHSAKRHELYKKLLGE